MMDLLSWLGEGILPAWATDALRLAAFWGPVVSLPGLTTSIGLLGSLLSLVILSGVMMVGLGTFVLAALLLYLLLTEVFGVRVELTLAP